ncbi:hypothetical protein ABPG72_017127 [Tetrahymena utriculariae]
MFNYFKHNPPRSFIIKPKLKVFVNIFMQKTELVKINIGFIFLDNVKLQNTLKLFRRLIRNQKFKITCLKILKKREVSQIINTFKDSSFERYRTILFEKFLDIFRQERKHRQNENMDLNNKQVEINHKNKFLISDFQSYRLLGLHQQKLIVVKQLFFIYYLL